jgi:hypothetical protein
VQDLRRADEFGQWSLLRRLSLRRLVGALGVRPVAVALMPQERKLVLRAVRELAEREGSPQALDVLQMLENALDARSVPGLAPAANRARDHVEGLA